MSSAEPEVILFERSPYGTLDAIVQHDGKSVYFYLNQPEQPANSASGKFGTRACWVRNLDVGPLVIDENQMKLGISPMLPRTECVDPDPQPLPDADRLQVVWLEEGNGAALIEMTLKNDPANQDGKLYQTLAVIPPWSGLDGFHGYAEQCAVENPLCWPMPTNENLHQRIDKAFQFWNQWEEPNDPFSVLQPQVLSAYESAFGPCDRYFAIDGEKFPPRGMAVYTVERNDSVDFIFATVAMSICPQPAVEIFSDEPSQFRRIELAMQVSLTPEEAQGLDLSEGSPLPDRLAQLAAQISGLAAYPWNQFTWFAPGHTCGFANPAPGCDSIVFMPDAIRNRQNPTTAPPVSNIPAYREDPVNLLWLVPITGDQQSQLQTGEATLDSIAESIEV